MFSKETDPSIRERSVDAINLACRLYKDTNKRQDAAKLLVELGQQFQESEDFELAITTFKEAAQLYKDDGVEMQAAAQQEVIGELLLKQKKFQEAAGEFKRVAEIRMKDRLTQFGAPTFFVKALLCRLGEEDVVGARRDFDEFLNMSPSWERSREAAFLLRTFSAIENRDGNEFGAACAEYNQIKGKLDRWMSEILADLKKKLDGDEEDLT